MIFNSFISFSPNNRYQPPRVDGKTLPSGYWLSGKWITRTTLYRHRYLLPYCLGTPSSCAPPMIFNSFISFSPNNRYQPPQAARHQPQDLFKAFGLHTAYSPSLQTPLLRTACVVILLTTDFRSFRVSCFHFPGCSSLFITLLLIRGIPAVSVNVFFMGFPYIVTMQSNNKSLWICIYDYDDDYYKNE